MKAQFTTTIPRIDDTHTTYKIFFTIPSKRSLTVGKLGTFEFPAGDYAYTGSAKKNMKHRLTRHVTKQKRLRWHIDYLLALKDVTVNRIELFSQPECTINASTPGTIPVRRFGASDCKSHCVSHLKLLRKL
ncbi:MAG: GIY-YIG nuclease family protein [Bacteroidetes bacterium]|nr:GIY-YIG nuclease family protein [Bacteroidota bacterium]